MLPLPVSLRTLVIAVVALSVGAVCAWLGYRLGESSQKDATLALQAQVTAVESAKAKGWESALKLYREAQQAEDDAVQGAAATITGLRGELATARSRLRAAQQNSPECKAWSDQPIACPF